MRLLLTLVFACLTLTVSADQHLMLMGAGKPSGAAPSSPLLTNLIAYWDLDEASGNAIDVHDDNDLTESVGTIASATGKVGNARDFEAGDTEYFTIADNTDLSTGDIDFTFAGWIQLESGGAARTAVSKYLTTGNQREYIVDYDNTGSRFRFYVSNDGTTLTIATANNLGAPSTATWYFFVAWHDATANTINIQVDNGTADSTAHTTGVLNGTAPFRLGATGFPANYWDGLIDEIGFWKRVLTTDEKTWLYNAGSGRSYADIVTCAGC